MTKPHKQGQPNKYFVHDLLAAWQGFLDEGVDLPPLLERHYSSLADLRHVAGKTLPQESLSRANPRAEGSRLRYFRFLEESEITP